MWLVDCALLLSVLSFAAALDNGLGRLPQMGWNSWYDLEDQINEENVRATADALISTGLSKLGYTYINLDDCWAGGRFPNGSVYAEQARFPSRSLKPLADYVHSLGLKFGTYTDRGTKTCAGRPGSQGYETNDAQTYASWGVDYVKEDSCFASDNHDEAFHQYGLMRDALNKTGRRIFFSLCGWNPWYAPVGASLGNSWRIGPDDTDWPGVLQNININSQLAKFAGPGGWNDPCLLLADTYKGDLRMTTRQTRTQFNMWAVMASPLLISANIRNMNPENLETYKNIDVIAIDQDPLGLQGRRLVGGDLSPASAVMGPLAATACRAGDLTQRWTWDTPSASYLHNNFSGLCMNVDDCQTDLILFSCVTSGGTCCGPTCYKNMQFTLSAGGVLASPVHPTLCATVQSDGKVSLDKCDPSALTANQTWSYDAGTQQLRVGASETQALCLAPQAGAGTNVWARRVTKGWAMLFINAGATAADIECDAVCFAQTSFGPGQPLRAFDLWTKTTTAATATSYVARGVPADGGSVFILFSSA